MCGTPDNYFELLKWKKLEWTNHEIYKWDKKSKTLLLVKRYDANNKTTT